MTIDPGTSDKKATSSELASALTQLKMKYIAHLGDKMAEMDALYPSALPATVTLESLLKLTRVAHKLAGSGKTFDLPSISDAGRALEMLLTLAAEEMSEGSLSSLTKTKIGKAIGMVKKECQLAIHNSKSDHVSEVAVLPKKKPQTVLIAAGSDVIPDTGQLREQLQYLGYEARMVDTIADLKKDQKLDIISAIIIITSFSKEDTLSIRAYLKKREMFEETCPILYLTPQNTFDMRLAAIRLRGDAFLTLPVDHLQLIDKLGTLAEHNHSHHCHVLIVDDDEMLAARYGIALEKAGMSVTVLSDPKQALEILNTASIDLVLLDFDMPGCTGFELASMLRQIDNYVRLPILFLSVQSNLESQLKHAHLGIDDFLTKPVSVEQLVKAVSGRAARSSMLHKFIDQDGATGLINHTRLKKELALEVSRSKRKKGQFSYALLDIDHFKKVNDTFGHAMGDVVIKTLAHLLRQRLRFTDIIGRYGGEEFGVILPDADAQQALLILQQIHTQFSTIAFTGNKKEFNVTFSGGIAAFPTFATDTVLSLAADQALYQAKHQGRNQLVIGSVD